MIISYRSTNDLQLSFGIAVITVASSPPLYLAPANFSIILRRPEFLNPAAVNIRLHENTPLSNLTLLIISYGKSTTCSRNPDILGSFIMHLSVAKMIFGYYRKYR